jgi:hypothetical protein
MSFQFDTLHISHQLTTGIGYPECLGFDRKIIRGSVYLDGPTIIGDENTFKTVEASLMIGPCNNTDSPIPTSSCSEGLSICSKDIVGPYSLVVRAGPHVTRDIKCAPDGAGPGNKSGAPTDTVTTPSTESALFIGNVDVVGFHKVQNDIDAAGQVYSNCRRHRLSAKKNFDIPHPSKEGWRLTHACVEGPEAAVYVRGRVKNQTEIHLPEYWTKLVDPDTITVSLTPIGSHQDVIIKRIGDNKIYLQSKGGMPIDCFYHIFGERIDTEKLIPEYKGTIEDYPGDNTQRSIAGYTYDTKE